MLVSIFRHPHLCKCIQFFLGQNHALKATRTGNVTPSQCLLQLHLELTDRAVGDYQNTRAYYGDNIYNMSPTYISSLPINGGKIWRYGDIYWKLNGMLME